MKNNLTILISLIFIILLWSCKSNNFTDKEKAIIKYSYDPYKDTAPFRLDTLKNYESIGDLLKKECLKKRTDKIIWVGFIYNLQNFSIVPSNDPNNNIVIPCALKICGQYGAVDHFYDEIFIQGISKDSLTIDCDSESKRIDYFSYNNYLDSLLNGFIKQPNISNIEFGINVIIDRYTPKENLIKIITNSFLIYNRVGINWLKDRHPQDFKEKKTMAGNTLYINPLYLRFIMQRPKKNYYFLEFD